MADLTRPEQYLLHSVLRHYFGEIANRQAVWPSFAIGPPLLGGRFGSDSACASSYMRFSAVPKCTTNGEQ
jgi:hypothetical protein